MTKDDGDGSSIGITIGRALSGDTAIGKRRDCGLLAIRRGSRDLAEITRLRL